MTSLHLKNHVNMSHFVLTLFSKNLGNDVLTSRSDLCSISFDSENS